MVSFAILRRRMRWCVSSGGGTHGLLGRHDVCPSADIPECCGWCVLSSTVQCTAAQDAIPWDSLRQANLQPNTQDGVLIPGGADALQRTTVATAALSDSDAPRALQAASHIRSGGPTTSPPQPPFAIHALRRVLLVREGCRCMAARCGSMFRSGEGTHGRNKSVAETRCVCSLFIRLAS